MPGMTANLTSEAYAIWEGVPMKKKGVDKGRSAWISSVILQHTGWLERYNLLLDDNLLRKEQIRMSQRTIDDLQRTIHHQRVLLSVQESEK